jgi:hypothetical protein
MQAETKTFFTIEVYNRRKWSDKYSCTYSTREEAEERARELYFEHEKCGNIDSNAESIHTCYRIKETTTITTIHEL